MPEEHGYADVPIPVFVAMLVVVCGHIAVAYSINDGWVSVMTLVWGFVVGGAMPEVYLLGRRSRS